MRDKRVIMSSLTNMSIYLVKLCEVRIMSFEELKEVFVDTLNCDADKVTMAASLTEDPPEKAEERAPLGFAAHVERAGELRPENFYTDDELE